MKNNKAWYWIPLLNFASGFPYVIIISVSVLMYKNLGISNEDIGLYTSLLYLPWVIKPLWSPFIDLYGTKRKWFLSMQLLISLAFLLIGFIIPANNFFLVSLAIFWVAAFASASNDVASDGFYMLALEKEQQSFFLGIRSTFYRISMLAGNGLIILLAGYLEHRYSDNTKAWSLTMIAVGLLMTLLTVYNFFATPKTEVSKAEVEKMNFGSVFASFFKKKQIVLILAFILLFRLGESQLLKMLTPFLVDPVHYELVDFASNENQGKALELYYNKAKTNQDITKEDRQFLYANLPLIARMGNNTKPLLEVASEDPKEYQKLNRDRINAIKALIEKHTNQKTFYKGGLGLETEDVGIIYGTLGILALTIGGILGGIAISTYGLTKCMFPMFLTMHLPIIGFIGLAHFHPEQLFHLYLDLSNSIFQFKIDHYLNLYACLTVVLEQFGYGFGFTAFMMYLIFVAEGESKTAHYAIATGFMALGMMLPGMLSGYIQEFLGYEHFFIWVLISTIPGLILSRFLIFPQDYGKKID